ncbi:site-2 protease family protein [Gloeocapsa sp. PCC 73106]|uniref:site-2 protease family protein n=1 Tax=Gloeocapsa sp. PCC 73106 TaxID=102232 RepID=UPI0002ABB912|nr:site-2 protease family protein [Gloeocapsa sp. PCC 73106]ELR97377.1 putative membrane-associated Zn-dependent protease [Gloeocapsa sp. PCC 73106]
MEQGLLLILLGLISYLVVQRSVTKSTKTPVWVLWLVIMIPAFVWTAWLWRFGEDTPLPVWLVIVPFIISPLLYWWLIELGRIPLQPKSESTPVTPVVEDKAVPTRIRPITQQEEESLRNCFPWGVYYLQDIDYRPQAILCRGKLKTFPENAYQTIKQNVEQVFGDRFLLLFQEGMSGQPFFALVPNVWAKQDQETLIPINKPFLALGLLLITLFTTTVVGVEFTGVATEEFRANPELLLQGLPYSLGLIAILAVHELSHYGMALYYRMKVTLPYFIPVPFFLGTFGAFIQMRSPAPHRKALFDTAIAGPIGGLLVTIPLLLWGLAQSQTLPEAEALTRIEETNTIPLFKNFNPRFSLLIAIFSKMALGARLAPGVYLDLHPLAIAGLIGILVTAFNLIPVGQLDGGHIVHAMLGQSQGMLLGQVARVLMFILAIVQPPLVQPIFFLWAIMLIFMPMASQPALNDVTELDNRRDFFGLLSLVLLLMILLPLPGALAKWLVI